MTGAYQKTDIHTVAPAWLIALRRFWLSPYFFALLLVAGCVFTALSAEVAGAMAFVWLILVILVTSDDAFAALVPFLLLTVLVSACYDGYDLFIPYVWMIAPALAALLFHFIYYRGHFSAGYSTAPLFAVSIAVTLGGIGCLSPASYFTPATLYYVAGLGFGMLAVYLLLRASLARKRDYDVRRLLLTGLYLVGIYATFFTLLFYAERLVWMQDDLEIFGHLRLISIDNRNVYATFLLLALPAPFYHAARGRGWHLVPAFLFYAAMLLTGSRGGMVMGTALFALCYLYLLRRDKKHRLRNLILLGMLLAAALAAGGFLLKFYSFRFENGFIEGDEPRVRLLSRALSDFLHHPIFGVGLGYTGNADIYAPKTFAMNWYHMMIPQIIAGMGLVGTLAYLFLFWRRGKLILKNSDPLSRALALSYAGLFLMSQVNPGEFCPMPYELIAVLIFLFLEDKIERELQAAQEKTEQVLTATLRTALFDAPLTLPADTDLNALLALAEAHMVFGVVGEGLGKLPEDALPQEPLLSLQDKTVALLRQNETLAAARRGLCRYLREKKIPAVILKGDSVAALYPTPDLRVAGDIDCLVEKEDIPAVGAYLTGIGYLPSSTENDHHVTYRRGTCKIELHHAPSGIPTGKTGERINAYLADILTAARTLTLLGDEFPAPSDLHQALILLLHMQQHLREGGLGLRQFSDWALFVAKDLQKSTVPGLLDILHEVGLYRFAETITTAAVRHLGLPAECSPFPAGDAALADALYADLMASGNFGRGNEAFAGSAIVTLHRHEGKGGLATALENVKIKCRVEWPSAQKHPLLLVALVPYWVVRRLLKAPVRPLSMLRSATARGALYDKLELFQEREPK